jgi:hypothetical protein
VFLTTRRVGNLIAEMSSQEAVVEIALHVRVRRPGPEISLLNVGVSPWRVWSARGASLNSAFDS